MKRRWLLPVLTVICIIAVIGMISVLVTGEKQKGTGFVPPPFEETAQTGTPDVPEHSGYSEMDAQAFRFSVCGVLTACDGKADVWLTNPEGNEVWMKLRMLDGEGNVLGETGLIKPGEYVQSVTLDTSLTQSVDVKLKIMAYEPETYYSAGSAVLNTTIQISD